MSSNEDAVASELRHRNAPQSPPSSTTSSNQPTNPTVTRRSNSTPSLVTGESKGSSILPLLLIFGIFAYVFNEISSGFLNNGGTHDVHAANQIKLIQTSFDVPLQLIFDGGYADVPLPEGKQVICSLCSGSGAAPGHSTSCPYCQGKGYALRTIELMPGFRQNMRSECPHCGGSGLHVTKRCPRCNGNKLEHDHSATARVYVPRGCAENHIVTMLNVGHQVLGLSSAGAVRVMLRSAPHPIFQRRNQLDLQTKLTITLREALLGFRKQIMHLSGKTVTVERVGVTAHDLELEFKNEGLSTEGKFYFFNKTRGSLFVSFDVQMPSEDFVLENAQELHSLL